MTARTSRDWLADIGGFLFAVAFSVVTADDALAGRQPAGGFLALDQAVGALACCALFLRRRWPVQLAVVLLVAGKFSHFVTGPAMVALFTVAANRPLRTTRWIAALAALPVPILLITRPDLRLPSTTTAIVYLALIAASFGWGLYVRSRRELVRQLRERAERAGADARRKAREDIAREMHDVLAHRLSLLSVHAGALEFNPGASEAEVARAAGVIRESAHQALDDLREIIGVLRAGADGAQPQPVLTDIEHLVAESRQAGTEIVLEQEVDGPAGAPAATGRTAYRIVQEGLTNARKHAPSSAVTVSVIGRPGDGLSVEIRNRADPGHRTVVPGAGQGLVGAAERVALVGGRLEHGWVGDDFRLAAWLPWPMSPDQPTPDSRAPAQPVSNPLPPAQPASGALPSDQDRPQSDRASSGERRSDQDPSGQHPSDQYPSDRYSSDRHPENAA